MAPKRQRLAQRRHALGMSQEALARLVDVDRTTVARWEAGENTPHPWQRPKLARRLEVSIEELADMLAEGLATDDLADDDERRLPPPAVAGNEAKLVDLDRSVEIDIAADGWAQVSYRYTILNNSDQPLVRFVRDIWFEHAGDRLDIEPLQGDERNVAIQRIHEAPNLAKFACLLSPAVQPGETAVVRYRCSGGRFLDHLYWRQNIQRVTNRVCLQVRHRDAGQLLDYSATEERPDGTELYATDSVEWTYEDRDVLLSVTRRHLRPSQAVTLRWSVENPVERTTP